MKETKTILLPKETVEKWQRLLDMEELDFEAEEVDTDATLLSETVKFKNGYVADMKVCSGQNNCWVEVVLFDNGCEISVSEPSFVLLGETHFNIVDNTFIVDVVQKQ